MKTTLKARRILLDEEAAGHLEAMINAVAEEGGHVTKSPSRAASWIICEFAARYFSKDRDRLKDTLFNRKTFLMAALKDLKEGNDEEIERLESTLRGLRQKRRVMPKGRENGNESKSESNTDTL